MDETNLSHRARNLGSGAKSSCKRFVDNASPEERQKFLETGELEDLYQNNRQMPNPRPTQVHTEYMLEYARQEYNE